MKTDFRMTACLSRICGNSAFILGSTVELESGLKHFLAVFSDNRVNIVEILCYLLMHPDSECVLNAAGTLGTIVCRSEHGNL